MNAMVHRTCKFAVVIASSLAVLATGLDDVEASHGDDETRGMMEFSLGPYHPMVDAEFDNGPYGQFFDSRSMLYGEVQVDYHLWQRIGKLSLGVHAGYARISGSMRDQDGEEIDADERTAFRIIPVKTSLVYRYDYSAHHHNIPLVPVAKAGLNYNFWRVVDPAGDTADVDGARGSGGRLGWHATLGLHFHLDFLDPSTAAAFEMTWGIANSYLFAEYTWTRVGAFADGINLGANHWSAGLAFEF